MQTATFIEQPQEIYISFLHKKEISRVYMEKKVFRYFEGTEDFIKQQR